MKTSIQNTNRNRREKLAFWNSMAGAAGILLLGGAAIALEWLVEGGSTLWWAIAFPAQIFALILLTDFLSGVVHWAEDAYGSEDLPIIGKTVIKPNIEHHFFPRNMTKNSWFKSAGMLMLLGLLAVGLAAWIGFLSWQFLFVVALGVNVNEVHKWAHRSPRENGKFITWLQNCKIVQGRKHHARHHTDPKDSHYCALTNVVNPVLDGINFWGGIEKILERIGGWKRRVDPSVKRFVESKHV